MRRSVEDRPDNARAADLQPNGSKTIAGPTSAPEQTSGKVGPPETDLATNTKEFNRTRPSANGRSRESHKAQPRDNSVSIRPGNGQPTADVRTANASDGTVDSESSKSNVLEIPRDAQLAGLAPRRSESKVTPASSDAPPDDDSHVGLVSSESPVIGQQKQVTETVPGSEAEIASQSEIDEFSADELFGMMETGPQSAGSPTEESSFDLRQGEPPAIPEANSGAPVHEEYGPTESGQMRMALNEMLIIGPEDDHEEASAMPPADDQAPAPKHVESQTVKQPVQSDAPQAPPQFSGSSEGHTSQSPVTFERPNGNRSTPANRAPSAQIGAVDSQGIPPQTVPVQHSALTPPAPMSSPPPVDMQSLYAAAQPSVVHVPVPVPMPVPFQAPQVADSVVVEGQPKGPARKTPEVKLPEVAESGVDAPAEETESDEAVGAQVEASSPQESDSDAGVETIGVSRQRLDRFVSAAKKDLFLIQESPPEELPRKIRKLVNELSVVRDVAKSNLLIRRLGGTRSPSIVQPLQEFAHENAAASEPMRVAVVQAVAQVPDPISSIFLLSLLTDSSSTVVEESIRGLVFLRREECLLSLVAAGLTRSSYRSVLQDALLAEANSVQMEYVDRFKKLLNHEDDQVVVVAIDLISKLASEGQMKLFSRLVERESPEIRAAAIEALVRTGENQSVRYLNKAIKDPSSVVRAAAASGLGQIHSPRSTLLLVSGLSDEDVRVRRNCARSLTQIEDDRIPKGAALALKNESDPTTIEYLLQGLGQTGSPAAFETLRKYLNSGEQDLCHRAMSTLRKLRDRKSAKMVLPFLASEDPETRRQAAETLGLLCEPKAAPRIRELLKADGATEVRAAAARALGELEDQAGVPALEEALYDERSVKCQAVIALGRLKSKSSIPAIMAQLRDPGADVRYHACSALGQMGEIPNPERLQEMLDDRDPMVQRGSKAALEKLGVSYRKGRIASRIRKVAANLVPSQIAGGLPLGGSLIALVVVGLLSFGGYTLFTGGLSSLSGPSFRISEIQQSAISPDGKLVSVSRKFRVFETWNVESGELMHRFELPGGANGLQYSDEKTLLVFTAGGVSKLSPAPGATLDSLKPTALKSLSTYLVSPTPDGAYAAFCGFRGDIQVVDLKKTEPSGKPFKMRDFVKESSMALTNDASIVLVGLPDGGILVYNAGSGEMIGRLRLNEILKKPKVTLTSMCLNASSSLLAAGTSGGEVVVIDLNNGLKVLGIPHAGKSKIVELCFKGDECVYVEGAGGLGVCRSDLASSEPLKTRLDEPPKTVKFSLDGAVAIVGYDEDKAFTVVDIENDKVLLDANGEE